MNHPDLKRGDGELYARLDTYWRENKDGAYPFQATLATAMGESVKTVRRRLKRLETAKLIKVKRQGLTKPNLYIRMRPQDLHVVPDEKPDGSPVTVPDGTDVPPDGTDVPAPDGTPLTARSRRSEASASEKDAELSVDGGAKSAPPSSVTDEALVALVETLSDSDARTLKVFRPDFGHLDAGAVWFALDTLEERRRRARTSPSAYDPIHHEAGYARGILEAVANGYSRYDDWSAFDDHVQPGHPDALTTLP